jgi:hypothetical protein
MSYAGSPVTISIIPKAVETASFVHRRVCLPLTDHFVTLVLLCGRSNRCATSSASLFFTETDMTSETANEWRLVTQTETERYTCDVARLFPERIAHWMFKISCNQSYWQLLWIIYVRNSVFTVFIAVYLFQLDLLLLKIHCPNSTPYTTTIWFVHNRGLKSGKGFIWKWKARAAWEKFERKELRGSFNWKPQASELNDYRDRMNLVIRLQQKFRS